MDEKALPRWVRRCWPRTWRDSYGEEMAQVWMDAGGSWRSLVPPALQGLRQRVVRPVAAASVEPAPARPGHDVAIVARPRYLLISIIAAATVLAVAAAEFGLGAALAGSPSPASRGAASVLLTGLIDRGLLLALVVFVVPAVVTGLA